MEDPRLYEGRCFPASLRVASFGHDRLSFAKCGGTESTLKRGCWRPPTPLTSEEDALPFPAGQDSEKSPAQDRALSYPKAKEAHDVVTHVKAIERTLPFTLCGFNYDNGPSSLITVSCAIAQAIHINRPSPVHVPTGK